MLKQLINKIINQNSFYLDARILFSNNLDRRASESRTKEISLRGLGVARLYIVHISSIRCHDSPLPRRRSIGHVSSITQNRFNQRRIFHGRKAGEYSRKVGGGKLACCEVGADHDESMRSGICGRVNANMHLRPRSPRY